MARLKLFAKLRESAGIAETTIEAATVELLVEAACRKFGPAFSAQVREATVALNGTELSKDALVHTSLEHDDEVALLPPVSGGSYCQSA